MKPTVVLIAGVLMSVAVSASAQRRQSAPPTGTLLVEGDQPGAELYIDGEPMGILPVSEPMRLSAGEHTVRAVRPGFTEFSDVVQIPSGGQARVVVNLLPISMALLVMSDPEDAQVFVDGNFAGDAPLTLDLGDGEHEIMVRAIGYHDAIRTVTGVAGSSETVEVSLEPLPQEERDRIFAVAEPEWYEEPLPWILIGGGALLITAAVVAIVLVTQEQPTEQEEFCSGGMFPCAVFGVE